MKKYILSVFILASFNQSLAQISSTDSYGVLKVVLGWPSTEEIEIPNVCQRRMQEKIIKDFPRTHFNATLRDINFSKIKGHRILVRGYQYKGPENIFIVHYRMNWDEGNVITKLRGTFKMINNNYDCDVNLVFEDYSRL